MIQKTDKKLTAALAYYVSVAVVLFFFTACGNNNHKVELKTLEDTLAYSMGSMQKLQYMNYIETSCKVDTNYRAACFEGIEEGYKDREHTVAYYDGINIGIQIMSYINQTDTSLVNKQFVEGMIDGALGKELKKETDGNKVPEKYTKGVNQSRILKEYIKGIEYKGVTLKDFIEGFRLGSSSYNVPEEYAFLCGKVFGGSRLQGALRSVNMQVYGDDTTKALSSELFYAGFMECNLPTAAIPHRNANDAAMLAMYKINTKLYSDNKKKNEEFLSENSKKPGVTTLSDGIQYKVIKETKGKKPTKDSHVEIHCVLKTIEGNVVLDSHDYAAPIPVDIKHEKNLYYREILPLMSEGSVYEVYVPQHLGFGFQYVNNVKPFSTIIYQIELIKITK